MINQPNPNSQGNPRTFYEEISIAGNQLVEQIEKMIKEGNIRRLIIKESGGRTLLEIPLTLGVVAGNRVGGVFAPPGGLGRWVGPWAQGQGAMMGRQKTAG